VQQCAGIVDHGDADLDLVLPRRFQASSRDGPGIFE